MSVVHIVTNDRTWQTLFTRICKLSLTELTAGICVIEKRPQHKTIHLFCAHWGMVVVQVYQNVLEQFEQMKADYKGDQHNHGEPWMDCYCEQDRAN